MAVDRHWRLYVDPQKARSWSVAQLGAVLVHELVHVLRDHAGRADQLGIGPGTHWAWNVAADAEINDDLLADGLELAGCPVTPAAMGWPERRLAEDYYGRINRIQPAASSGSERPCEIGDPPESGASETVLPGDCGSGSGGGRRGWEDHDAGANALGPGAAAEVRASVAAAVRDHARATGAVPAGIARWAEATLEPRVDWRRQLAGEIRRGIHSVSGRSDYRWSRPSRRASAVYPIILPGMQRPIPELALVIDTSASMSEDELQRLWPRLTALPPAWASGPAPFRSSPVMPPYRPCTGSGGPGRWCFRAEAAPTWARA